MSSLLSLPSPLRTFFAFFPLYTYPPTTPPFKTPLTTPTLWIHPPYDAPDPLLLSADVECLKWQAYLALRGLSNIKVRWDIKPEGAIDGRLPTLHLPAVTAGAKGGKEKLTDTQLLAAHLIPGWVDSQVGAPDLVLEGYKDESARDESRAWVTLLEGAVYAALILVEPSPPFFSCFHFSSQSASPHRSLQALLTPPPPPLTGLSTIIPPSGMPRIHPGPILAQYRDAIAALAERLGTDKWFLGSSEPTPLDALAFAYLHYILHARDSAVRVEVTRRVNLVAWEWRVRGLVRVAFI